MDLGVNPQRQERREVSVESGASEKEACAALVAECSFETFDTPFGLGVRYVQRKGRTAKELMKAINAMCQDSYGLAPVFPALESRDDFALIMAAEDIEYEFVAVVEGSVTRFCDDDSESRAFSDAERFLGERGLSPVPIPALVIAGALFHWTNGLAQWFDKSQSLFRGCHVYAAHIDSDVFSNPVFPGQRETVKDSCGTYPGETAPPIGIVTSPPYYVRSPLAIAGSFKSIDGRLFSRVRGE